MTLPWLDLLMPLLAQCVFWMFEDQLVDTIMSCQKSSSSLTTLLRHMQTVAGRSSGSYTIFKHQTGAQYLGSFLGSDEDRQEWLRPQIQTWVKGIKKLATVAHRFPQTAYAGLVQSLQSEWTYLQRVVPDCGMALAPTLRRP